MANPPRPADTIAQVHRVVDKALGIAMAEMQQKFGKSTALDQLAVVTLAGTILNLGYGPASIPEIRAALER